MSCCTIFAYTALDRNYFDKPKTIELARIVEARNGARERFRQAECNQNLFWIAEARNGRKNSTKT